MVKVMSWDIAIRLSNHFRTEWFKQIDPISETAQDEFAISGISTVTASVVVAPEAPPFITAFIGGAVPSAHSILAASGINIIYGATDDDRPSLTVRERSVVDRMMRWAWSSRSPGIRMADKRSPLPRACLQTPETLLFPTLLSSLRQLPNTNSITYSPRAASTKASRRVPSTPSGTGAQTTAAVC